MGIGWDRLSFAFVLAPESLFPYAPLITAHPMFIFIFAFAILKAIWKVILKVIWGWNNR